MPLFARAVLVLAVLLVVWLVGSRHHETGADNIGDFATIVGSATIWKRWRYYLVVDAQRRPRTVTAYRFIIWDWFAFLDPKGWHKATARDLHRYLNRPTRSGRAAGNRLGANTRLHYAATVCAFYAWAQASGHLRKNPMAGVKLPRGGIPVPRSFPLPDLRQILLAAEHDPRLYVMCVLGYFCGLRCAEIAQVRVEDLTLGDRPRLLVHGKGGRDRILPLHPELRAAVVRVLAAGGHPKVGPLVSSRRRPGEPMTPGSVSRALSDHIRGLGIEGSGHGLRHSAATELLAAERGRNLQQVVAFLGHRSDRTTRRYVQAYDWELADQIPRIPDPRKGVQASSRTPNRGR
jgi:integrase/recombinase XerC